METWDDLCSKVYPDETSFNILQPRVASFVDLARHCYTRSGDNQDHEQHCLAVVSGSGLEAPDWRARGQQRLSGKIWLCHAKSHEGQEAKTAYATLGCIQTCRGLVGLIKFGVLRRF